MGRKSVEPCHPSEHYSYPSCVSFCPSPPCALGAQWESPDVGDPSRSWFSVVFPPQPDRLFCQRPPLQEGSGSLFRERLILGASQHISPGSGSHPEASRPRAAQERPLKKRNKEVAKQPHPLLPHVHAYARLLALPACGVLRAGAVLPTLRRGSPKLWEAKRRPGVPPQG